MQTTLLRPDIFRHLPHAAAGAAAFLLIGVTLAITGPSLDAWMAEFNVTPGPVGTVFVTFSIGSLASTVAFPFAARWAGTTAVVAAGATLLAASFALVANAPTFEALAALFVLAGVGFTFIETGVNSLFVELFPTASGLALNWLHLFFAAGAAAGPPAFLGLSTRWGWRGAYLALAAGLALLALWQAGLARLRRPVASTPAANVGGGEKPSPFEALRPVARWGLRPAVAMFAYVGLEVGVTGWAFTLLVREAAASRALASLAVPLFWAGLTAGRFSLAAVVERLGYGRSVILASVLGGGSLVASCLVRPAALAVALLGLTGLMVSIIFPTLMALATRSVPAPPPVVTAWMLLWVTMGALLLPGLAGWVGEQVGLRAALAAWGLLLAVAAPCALARYAVPEVAALARSPEAMRRRRLSETRERATL